MCPLDLTYEQHRNAKENKGHQSQPPQANLPREMILAVEAAAAVAEADAALDN
jgi:hypothetical protein